MDTIQGNKIIAEFMGWVKHEDPLYHEHEMNKLEYHSSWEDLMPVIEKISTLHYPDYWQDGKPEDAGEYDDCPYPRTFGMRNKEGHYMFRFNANFLHTAPTLIEAAWLAVVDFIQWYNSQTNK